MNLFFKRLKTSDVIWMMKKLLTKMKTNRMSRSMKRKGKERKQIQARVHKWFMINLPNQSLTDEIAGRTGLNLAKFEIWSPERWKGPRKESRNKERWWNRIQKLLELHKSIRHTFYVFPLDHPQAWIGIAFCSFRFTILKNRWCRRRKKFQKLKNYPEVRFKVDGP